MARQWLGDEDEQTGDGPRTLVEIIRDLCVRLLGRDR